ncbi:MAG: flavin reductase [Flavobacteriaceae bacterium]|nr:flavin reductase [Flavobacteriaceae bacterium]
MKHAEELNSTLIRLDIEQPVWDMVFTVAPLVIIGSKEGEQYDLAPKHMATPLGFHNYFGFVCTPLHTTFQNIIDTSEFTVSFPKPRQVILSSLAAMKRCDRISKSEQIIETLPTFKAASIDALFVEDCYLYLECELFKIVDGFDENVLITGKVKAAMVDKDYLRTSDRSDQDQIYKNPLLAYISYGRYANIKETFDFPFPKDFKR